MNIHHLINNTCVVKLSHAEGCLELPTFSTRFVSSLGHILELRLSAISVYMSCSSLPSTDTQSQCRKPPDF